VATTQAQRNGWNVSTCIENKKLSVHMCM